MDKAVKISADIKGSTDKVKVTIAGYDKALIIDVRRDIMAEGIE